MTPAVLAAVLVFLGILASGFFSGAETGAYQFNRTRHRLSLAEGGRRAKLVQALTSDLTAFVHEEHELNQWMRGIRKRDFFDPLNQSTEVGVDCLPPPMFRRSAHRCFPMVTWLSYTQALENQATAWCRVACAD